MRTFSGRVLLWILPAMVWTANARAESSYDLRSPDHRIEIRIRTAGQIRYDVLLKGSSDPVITTVVSSWVVSAGFAGDTGHLPTRSSPCTTIVGH